MEIREHRVGRCVVVALEGRLDGAGARALEASVLAMVGRGETSAVLDFAGLSYLSSIGIRAVLICARTCRENGGRLAIARLRDDPLSVMEMSGLLSVMEHHETVEDALAATRRPAPGGAGAPAGFEIGERSAGSVVVVSLAGHLTGEPASALEARVCAVVERGSPRVVLDLARLSYLNSAGLRAVLLGAKACRRAGGALVIAAMQPQCHMVLKMSGFLSIIDAHETIDAAVAALA